MGCKSGDKKNRMGNAISCLKLTHTSGHKLMLPHKMASEMQCGPKQSGLLLHFLQSNSPYIVIITFDQKILSPLPSEHAPPIHVH